MTFIKKTRYLFNLSIILFLFFTVGFALYKILWTTKKFIPEKFDLNFNALEIHWEKNNYIVPTNNILINENMNLAQGDYYHVEQTLEGKNGPEKCYLGFLKLQAIKKDRYILFSGKIFDKSNLVQYSKLNSSKIMIRLITKNEFKKEKRQLNCKDWIQLINKIEPFKVTKQERHNNILRVPQNKCIQLPNKKFLSIVSLNLNAFSLEQDEIFKKIRLCAKSKGSSLILFSPLDGSPSYKVFAKSIPQRKKARNQARAHLKPKSFVKKTLPGWT